MPNIQKIRYFNKFLVLIIISCLLPIFIISCGDSATAEKEYLQRAKDYIETKELLAASLELKNILVSNPKHAEARYLLGKINLTQGDAASAEKETRRA
ncbi:MAG: hypothetical protein RQ982_09830, partial [Gammaproteobacteria bacterium]|nr:hypothetical protein [Gammaproteobacteria bacterium]